MGSKKYTVFLQCAVDHLMIQEWKRERGEKKKALGEEAVDNVVGIDFTFNLRHYCKEFVPTSQTSCSFSTLFILLLKPSAILWVGCDT